MRLPATSGSSELPGLQLGVHRFRIAAFRGRRFLAQQTSNIRVFGTVPFTTLFENENPSVFTAPGNSFAYVAKWNALWDGLYFDGALFGVRNNHCSSVHIAFATGYDYEEEKGIATLTVVQESRDPVGSSAPFNEVGSVDAELTPGQTWGVTASYTSAMNEDVDIYINGYATCYSTEPFAE